MSRRKLVFEGSTWEAYERLRSTNKVAHGALARILKEMLRGDPGSGSGRPERLRHNLAGLWSRRYTHSDRLIYCFDDEAVHVIAIGGHYDRR